MIPTPEARYVFDTNVLISVDADLLALQSFKGIPIRTPAEFLSDVAKP